MKKAVFSLGLIAVFSSALFAQNTNDFTFRTKSFNGTLGVVILGYQGVTKDVVIPSSINSIPVMEIGDQAFLLNNVKSVVIPKTVVRIGKQAFYGNRIEAVSIPESVREIGDNAFDSNLNLRAARTLAQSKQARQPVPQTVDYNNYYLQQPAPPPVVVQQPPVQQPVVVQKPMPVQQTAVVQQPAPVQQPVVIQKPTPVQQAAIVQQPAPVQQPLVVQQSASVQPIVVPPPAPAANPVVVTQPVPVVVPQTVTVTNPVIVPQTPVTQQPAVVTETYVEQEAFDEQAAVLVMSNGGTVRPNDNDTVQYPHRQVILPEEKRVFDVPRTLAGDYSSPKGAEPRPDSSNIPQRFAKAPPPIAAPDNNYSPVIPLELDDGSDEEQEKRTVVELVPKRTTALRSGDYIINIDGNSGAASIAGYRGRERNVLLPSKVDMYSPVIIGRLAFCNKYITSVKIPEGIIRIEDSAFSSNSLTDVVIPSSVRYVGYQAFNGNPLNRITIGAAVPMQIDSFPALFADYYRINGMLAGTYYLVNGRWVIDN
jgi:hypothetical protein